MTISDLIAQTIAAMMEENGSADFRRNELASRVGCAPSAINYVITSRFTPEQGYIVESQRGGGGYVRIRRVIPSGRLIRMHVVNALGDTLDFRTARVILQNLVGDGQLEPPAARMMLAAVKDTSLADAPQECRDRLRASILKQMLLSTLTSPAD